MRTRFFSVIAVVMVMLVMASCGKMPQAQIDAAKAAIDSTKIEQADIYVPAEFAGLQDSLSAYMAEVEAQSSKFFKSYGDVTVKLESIVASAAQVKANAVVKKEEVRLETEAMMTEIYTMIAENKDLILKAPKGKEGAAALEEIKNEMTVIEASVAEAATLFTNGEFMAALDKAKAAKENATTINSELKEAIEKVKRR
jgi:multidrug efflux pump subunit AcrA (membrane-fusion protein)